MLFDGSRALIVGDYITPKSGNHAGQYGPWAKVVKTVGIDPGSSIMKLIFVSYGLAYLTVMIAFLMKVLWAWLGMIILAALGLRYLPFGTLINILIILLLLIPWAIKA